MKNVRVKVIFVAIILIFASCTKNKESNDNNQIPTESNLVCNPSFEINGVTSLICWNIVKNFVSFPDTFSTVVPNNGGIFSLKLDGVKDANLNPYVETYLTNFSGQKIVSLSAYVKSLYGGQSIYLWLEQIRNGQIIRNKSYSNWAFNGWEKFSLIDTLAIQPQDSLRIKIVQTTGQNSGALIDLVKLTMN